MAQRNLLGTPLEICSLDPLTGFYRDGYARTGPGDVGSHTVCAVVTAEFLDHQRSCGNDLVTPRPTLGFPGLKPGDRWAVCASRWQQSFDAGVACGVVLAATSGAINVRLTPQLDPLTVEDDEVVGDPSARPDPQLAHLSSVVGLVWRAVVLWMLLLALLTLAGL